LPFDNTVTAVTMTGAQITTFVNHLAARRANQAPHISGMHAKYIGGKFVIYDAQGKAIAASKTYKVATNDFLVMGGEELASLFADVPKGNMTFTDTDMRDALIDYFKKNHPSTRGAL